MSSQYHTEVCTNIGDVGDPQFVSELVSDTLKHFGQIDLLINNAGIAHIGLLSDLTLDLRDRLISVNLSSVFYTCKAVIPSMVHWKQGRILNISSVWGETGAIDTDMKHCFTNEELNALSEVIPAGRMGNPEEVAGLALFLTNAPAYLNRKIITTDGSWI